MKRRMNNMDVSNSPPNKVSLVERNVEPQGLPLVNSYFVGKNSKNDLESLAAEIQKCDDYIRATACNKLQIIVEQMQFLRKQAENILLETKENTSLHHVACNFVKLPGKTYHLYQRQSGQCYFSMLSPEEWGEIKPIQVYKGSFRLEHDRSWTPMSQIQVKDNQLAGIEKLFQMNENVTMSVLDS